RRGADVDEVEVVHGEQIVEIGHPTRHVELVRQRRQPFLVEVAEGDDAELVRVRQVALDDMAAADAAADHCDSLDVTHCSHTVPRSASCCALSASSIALKQCSWVIAVSVRFSTSAIRCR